jgi:hypothetical protein
MEKNGSLEGVDADIFIAAKKLYWLTEADDYISVVSESFEALVKSKRFEEMDRKGRQEYTMNYNAIMGFFNDFNLIRAVSKVEKGKSKS